MVFMGALLVQWRFGPPVPKTIAEANNPDTAARTEKTWRERERETQRQREREREGEGIRKGILTVEIWNAVDTANDIKQLKKEVKAIESLGRPGVLQFFLVRSEHKALREAGVEWPC